MYTSRDRQDVCVHRRHYHEAVQSLLRVWNKNRNVKSQCKLIDMNETITASQQDKMAATLPYHTDVAYCRCCLSWNIFLPLSLLSTKKLMKFFENNLAKTYLWHLHCKLFILCTKAKRAWKRTKLIIGCFECISVSLSNVATPNEKGSFRSKLKGS